MRQETILQLIRLLKKTPPTEQNLATALGIAEAEGYRATDIALALRFMKTGETKVALSYLYGPSGATGKGAIRDLESLLNSSTK